jgi:hypothetical protein
MEVGMRFKLAMAFLIAGVFAIAPIFAQEGHPLSGSWAGTWGKDAEHIRLVVKWDSFERNARGVVVTDKDGKEKVAVDAAGKPVYAVTGMFRPGANSALAKMTLDSTKWTVHIETDYKGEDGKVSHIVADGKLDTPTIGAYKRTITGTWTQGTVKGDFKLERD